MSKTQYKNFDPGKIDFVGKMNMFIGISIAVFVGAVAVMFGKGLNYGIDFTGGTEVQVKFEQPLSDDGVLRKFLDEQGLGSSQLQRFGVDNEYVLRFETKQGKDDAETNKMLTERVKNITEGLTTQFASFGPEIRRVDSVGPQVGSQLKRNGVLAVFYSLIVILIYVGLRFDYNFAPGAVICLFHDAILVLGVFALMGKEINIQILAAILTLIGYSLNDTIVVFDRIRENLAQYKGVPLKLVINKSTNDTLSRTILTGVTTIMSTLCLYFIAGGVIADFAFAMTIGILFGTYSSIYVAAPTILFFEQFKTKRTPAAA